MEKWQMGAVCCCSKQDGERAIADESQYESLVTVKPPPMTLDNLNEQEENMDVPLFAPAKSDGDEPAVSDPETLTDDELNLYASKLPDSEKDSSDE